MRKLTNNIIPKTKICSACGEEKTAEKFGFKKNNLDGLQHYCKMCEKSGKRSQRSLRNERNKNLIKENLKECSGCNIIKNISEFKPKRKIYHYCNECRRAKGKELRIKNKQKEMFLSKEKLEEKRKNKKEYAKEYRETKLIRKPLTQKQKENRNRYLKRYRSNPENKRKRNERERKNRQNNIEAKLHQNFTNNIKKDIRRNNLLKNGTSSFSLVNYSSRQLKEHLESQFEPWMNWTNYGKYTGSNTNIWQIDHIIPSSVLKYDNFSDFNFKLCWSLYNLRPLRASENNEKRDKYKSEDLIHLKFLVLSKDLKNIFTELINVLNVDMNSCYITLVLLSWFSVQVIKA